MTDSTRIYTQLAHVPAFRGVVIDFPGVEKRVLNWGNDVEKIDPFAFYRFGKAFANLLHQSDPIAPQAVVFDCMYLAHQLDTLLKEGKPIVLGVSRASATALKDSLQDILNVTCWTKGEDGQPKFAWPKADAPPLERHLLDHVSMCVQRFEAILAEEMQEAATYYVPARGIFNTSALVEAADQSFDRVPGSGVAFLRSPLTPA